MAATIFSNASAVKPGAKIIVTQRIPSRVLKDQSSTASSSSIRDGTSNTVGFRDIPRGTIGHVIDKKAGRVVLEISGLKHEQDVIEFRDFDFEKYFAERL